MILLHVLWRRKLVIGVAAGASALLALAVSLGLPEFYRATATVLVIPPRYQAEASPPPPSAEAYSEIAMISDVIAGALERGGADGAADASFVDQARKRFRVDTYEERGNYNTVLVSPLLGLSVSDTDPERAVRLADAWAESFQEASRQFKGRGSRRIARALEDRAARAAARLEEAEGALGRFERETLLAILEQQARTQAQSVAAARTARLDAEAAMESSQQVLAALRAEAAAITAPGDATGDRGHLGARIAEANASLEESARAVRAYRRESMLSVLEEELDFKRKLLGTYRQEVRESETRLAGSQAEVERIAALLTEASRASPAKPLRASLTANPAVDAAGGDTADRLSELALIEQLQDQALQSLRERYYGARVDAESLGPVIEAYRAKVAELAGSLPALEEEIARHRDRTEKLEADRSLQRQRTSDLDQLARKLHSDIASLALEVDRLRARAAAHGDRERALQGEADRLEARVLEARLRRDHLARDLELARQLHSGLSAKAQEARAAEAGDASDVSIVSRAALPRTPVSPRTPLNVAAAMLFGLLASATLVVLTSGPSGVPRS